jgi:hypothetical protein
MKRSVISINFANPMIAAFRDVERAEIL